MDGAKTNMAAPGQHVSRRFRSRAPGSLPVPRGGGPLPTGPWESRRPACCGTPRTRRSAPPTIAPLQGGQQERPETRPASQLEPFPDVGGSTLGALGGLAGLPLGVAFRGQRGARSFDGSSVADGLRSARVIFGIGPRRSSSPSCAVDRVDRGLSAFREPDLGFLGVFVMYAQCSTMRAIMNAHGPPADPHRVGAAEHHRQ